MNDDSEKKPLTSEEAAIILSDALREVAERKTSLKRATAVSRLAVALARVLDIADLRARVEFLEQALKKRK